MEKIEVILNAIHNIDKKIVIKICHSEYRQNFIHNIEKLSLKKRQIFIHKIDKFLGLVSHKTK